MRITLWTVLLLLLVHIGLAQEAQIKPPKKVIDSLACEAWPEIQQQMISNDGKFVVYTIRKGNHAKLVLQTANGNWKREFIGGYNARISADSRLVFFQLTNDSMAILSTKEKHLSLIPNGAYYKVPDQDSGHWIAYKGKESKGPLTLRNLITGTSQQFSDVADFLFSMSGNTLLLQTAIEENGGKEYELRWVDLPEGKNHIISRSKAPFSSWTLDEQGKQLAFIATSESKNALMYYQTGMDSAATWISPSDPALEQGMAIGAGELQFSRSGKKLFFPLVRETQNMRKAGAAEVDVWSYKDIYLQSQQQVKLDNESARSYRAVVPVGVGRLVRLEKEEDDWTTFETAAGGDAQFISVRSKYDWSQEDWNPAARVTLSLVSTQDGSRVTVASKVMLGYHGKLYSPDGKYVIWYDREKRHYFTYNISTGQTKNISESVEVPLYNENEDHPRSPYPIGIAGWQKEDHTVLVYDLYDIWALDPDGIRLPVNVTNGYGRRSGTYLRYLPATSEYSASIVIRNDEDLMLCGFNKETKDNGFFHKKLDEKGDPAVLTMGPYLYYYSYSFVHVPELPLRPNFFLKAKNVPVYLLNRMTAHNYPNLYATTDFRKWTQLSTLHPEQDYNWLNSELLHWKTLAGKQAEGILYKPENFDPGKRYPVIFYFYEKDANALHNYLFPSYSEGQINIPTFVSNGYLVFDPNIYYQTGQPMESVYNSVASAADFLSRMPWVDSTHMGIQGHSFGGYEVNCLISRTGRFRAANSAAGFCNLTSLYGNLRTDFGITGLDWIEKGQTGLGVTLWQDPQLFLKNSPVFYADRITTPLLMMHNKGDGASPFSQGLEFFTALRRLGKKVWLLQYDRSSHQVEGTENRKDYSARLLQFFNHYLKSEPEPMWMSQGIPAAQKGITTGLDQGDGSEP